MHGFGLIFDKQHKRALVKEDYESAGIAGLFRDVSLEQIPKDAPYYAKVAEYIDTLDDKVNNGIGLILTGEHGGGKSGTAVVIVKEVMARGGSALFIEEASLISSVLNNEKFRDDMTYLERFQSVDLLAIDDVGLSAKSTTDNLHILEPLVKTRLRRTRRPTVITTNLKKDEFLERYPTLSALLEESFISVVCRGVPWRSLIRKRLNEKFRRETGAE